MKKAELVQRIAQSTGATQKDTEKMLDATIAVIEQALVEGDKVLLPGLGTLETKTRAARNCSNPRTGELIAVPAMQVPTFRAATTLKEKVNQKPCESTNS